MVRNWVSEREVELELERRWKFIDFNGAADDKAGREWTVRKVKMEMVCIAKTVKIWLVIRNATNIIDSMRVVEQFAERIYCQFAQHRLTKTGRGHLERSKIEDEVMTVGTGFQARPVKNDEACHRASAHLSQQSVAHAIYDPVQFVRIEGFAPYPLLSSPHCRRLAVVHALNINKTIAQIAYRVIYWPLQFDRRHYRCRLSQNLVCDRWNWTPSHRFRCDFFGAIAAADAVVWVGRVLENDWQVRVVPVRWPTRYRLP